MSAEPDSSVQQKIERVVDMAKNFVKIKKYAKN
jgi:hypothetical protein